jgi:hypothetical protein
VGWMCQNYKGLVIRAILRMFVLFSMISDIGSKLDGIPIMIFHLHIRIDGFIGHGIYQPAAYRT